MQENMTSSEKKKRHPFRILLIVLLVFVLAFLGYAAPYYHAVDGMQETYADVNSTASGYTAFYDGPGSEKALIFYPGAKVDEKAYEPLLEDLAENGIDCFLVKMPLHLAILGKNRAQSILESHPDYQEWILSGHSLGGAMAADFAAAHPQEVDGLVLLASYSTKKQKGDLKAVSIYGSEDGVLKMDSYEKYRGNLPEGFTEVVIPGGNHAGFGCYGDQKGDNPATITGEEQRKATAETILSVFKEAD